MNLKLIPNSSDKERFFCRLKNCCLPFSSRILIFFFISLFSVQLSAQELSIIPKPAVMEMHQGAFILDKSCGLQLHSDHKDQLEIANLFNNYMKEIYGFSLKNESSPHAIHFTIKPGLFLNPEAYLVKVDETGVFISASSSNGLFYGMESLRQILPQDMTNGQLKIPALVIKDKPRFSWRGNMLDVSRHFFSVDFIKKYIDILAMYKINTFHWHLTDDQGWRIEIKKYPALTRKGAWRNGTSIGHTKESDGKHYGGFYTQKEIREIVAYAKARYITIVPEIEMPGHAMAALASYPELGCSGGPYETGMHWGIYDDVYCAGKESTFIFLENVLSEVMALFPGKYIHIGGDEVRKTRWKNCPYDEARMKKEGLKNEEALQAYFIRRIEKFLNAHGRKLIGWDEILQGGITPNATVMSWRGIQGGIEAAKKDHDVVMSPLRSMYLNLYQSKDKESEPPAYGGFLPLEKVYAYEPVPDTLSASEAKHILGVQSNVWTEYISDSSLLEYMLLPRLQAQAEVGWTPKEEKDFEGFKKRLETDYARLKKMGINYRDHRK
jgi:hexosaminidase